MTSLTYSEPSDGGDDDRLNAEKKTQVTQCKLLSLELQYSCDQMFSV